MLNLKCLTCLRNFYTKTGFKIHSQNVHCQQQSNSETKDKTEETDSKEVLLFKDTNGEEAQTNKLTIDRCSMENIRNTKIEEKIQTNIESDGINKDSNGKQTKVNLKTDKNEKEIQTNKESNRKITQENVKIENNEEQIQTNKESKGKNKESDWKQSKVNGKTNNYETKIQANTNYLGSNIKTGRSNQHQETINIHYDFQSKTISGSDNELINKQFDCRLCHKVYTDESDCENHITSDHIQESPLQSQILREMYFKLNTEIQSINDTVKAFQSNQIDTSKLNVNDPIRSETHKEKKIFQCEDCKMTFTRKLLLSTHIKIIHLKMDLPQCPICKNNFSKTDHLRRHIKNVHTNQKTITIDHCDQKFRENQSLQKHFQKDHQKCLQIQLEASSSSKPNPSSNLPTSSVSVEDNNKIKAAQDYKNNIVGKKLFFKHCKIVLHKLDLMQCQICRAYYTSNFHLKSHMQKVHETQNLTLIVQKDQEKLLLPIQTNSCYNPTDTLKLPSAYINVKEKKTYECKECKKKFVNFKSYIAHIKIIHKKMNLNQCQNCKKIFTRSSSLRMHIKTVHQKLQPYECDQCKRSFGQQSSLKKHIQTVHEKLQPYECDQCKRSFGQQSGLKSHIESVHEKLQPHKCDQCERSFGQQSNLKIHIKTAHEKLQPYECDQCMRSFGFKSCLKKHIKNVHEKLRPHKCAQCERSFGQQSNLKKHIQSVHEKLKTFKCDACGKGFCFKVNLKSHVQHIHEKLPPLKCAICGKSSVNKSSLRRHVQKCTWKKVKL